MNEQQHPKDWHAPNHMDDLMDPLSLTSFETFDDLLGPLSLSSLDTFDPNQSLSPGISGLASMPSLENFGVAEGNHPISDVDNTNTTAPFEGLDVFSTDFASNTSWDSNMDFPRYDLHVPSFPSNIPSEHPQQQRKHTLPRRRSKYILRRSGHETGSSPIVISNGSLHSPLESAHGLAIQRWQNSPPEDEGASLSAIYKALENKPSSASEDNIHYQRRDAFYRHRGPSSTTSVDSARSDSSLKSCNSSHSATSRSKRRHHGPGTRSKAKAKNTDMRAADRIFKCTFCCDTFKNKYDWARHEKSLHLSMEEWVCSPHGGSVILPLTGRQHCAYCNALDPTHEHLEQHNHSACVQGRTFRRKDHLVQHLRLVHGLDTLPLIQDWKVASKRVISRCGFCKATLSSWDERTDHLAAHFRDGKTMADWQGDHGFEPAVTARLTYAYPPYLIAAQSKTLIPFSATDPASMDHTKVLQYQINLAATEPSALPEATREQAFTHSSDKKVLPTQQEVDTIVFADILTSHLSRFARQQMLAGILPTDEMFQRESRRVLYQDDDEWNQTVADDPKWLQHFREQTGFGGDTGA